jgi:hypothetical protein
MSFSDWINQDTTTPDPDVASGAAPRSTAQPSGDEDEAGWAFAHAARARAQAERQSNRNRRRRTWRARAVLARRALNRSYPQRGGKGDSTP